MNQILTLILLVVILNMTIKKQKLRATYLWCIIQFILAKILL